VAASRARQLTVGNQLVEQIAISPDGRWLAFDANRNGNQDIYKAPITGGAPEQLTSNPEDDFINSWSPDGQEIVYHTFRNGNRDVYAVSALGGEPRPIVVSPAQDRDGSWFPDGRRFLFASNRSARFELYVQTHEGNGWGRPTQLSQDGGFGGIISPSGQRILFDHGDRVAFMPSSGGRTTDLVLTGPLTGRERQVITRAWAGDGRVLLAMEADTSGKQQAWSMPIAGGAPRLILQMDEPRVGFGRGAMIERGGMLYFLMLRSESDIWTAELADR
jgi:TolB protein